ncbi:sigma-70 family RNA polymerase sigma factor [Sciscionella sediminilitoris]|uniref:sigma-70 family RNA polymerase sigma factor n=1 Tax=Sciscionella sediminilitoris TaxID=1445613 RepID=UPI00068EA164|nr:sigma-70 family RNA polymerase sigma factor [Sciscionella sp. SE31]
MSTVPAQASGPSDAELINSVRHGSTTAYGELYQRHVAAAYNLARQVSRSPAEADDLVSEAFAKVLDTLRAGNGPDTAFRAYLLTSLRHTAYDKTRRDRKVEYTDDVTTSGAPADSISVPFSDTAVAGLDRSLAARAFARLPERWQTVLWHMEVEGSSASEVATILGISPNGVSALAYRAREGLRQAYLQVHLAETGEDRCRATVDRLGAWTRGGLAKRETAQVEAHLDECEQCRALAAELADVNGALRAVLAPLVLGGAAAGYLAVAGSTTAHAATAVGAASSAGGAAGAAAAMPRQFIGVGVGTAAVAAAVAVAMTAGSGPQQIPTAAPAQQQPAPAAPKPPAPPAPPAAPPAQPPAAPPAAPPPAQPPQAPPPPAAQPPAQPPPQQPAPPAQPPKPGEPKVTAAGPGADISLEPGGPAVDVPITVTNTGAGKSEPVDTKLNLPPGVRAIGGGQGAGGPKAFALDAPAKDDSTVHCPGGTGTVECTTQRGLEPGEKVTMLFRLAADRDAKGGVVTGTVNSGTTVPVKVRVPVKVKPLPEDGVELRMRQLDLDPLRLPIVAMRVTNTGQTTKHGYLRYDKGTLRPLQLGSMHCDSGLTKTVCVTRDELRPGESARMTVLVPFAVLQTVVINGKARIGEATDTARVYVHRPLDPPVWPIPDEPAQPPGQTPDPTPGPSSSTEPTPPSTTRPGKPSPTRPSESSAQRPQHPSHPSHPSQPTHPAAPPSSTPARPTPTPGTSSAPNAGGNYVTVPGHTG